MDRVICPMSLQLLQANYPGDFLFVQSTFGILRITRLLRKLSGLGESFSK
jgi:hypothetical protein